MITITFLIALADHTWYLTEIETEEEDVITKDYEKIVEWALAGPLQSLSDEEDITLIAAHHIHSGDECKSFLYGNSESRRS